MEVKGGHTCWMLVSNEGPDEDLSTWRAVGGNAMQRDAGCRMVEEGHMATMTRQGQSTVGQLRG